MPEDIPDSVMDYIKQNHPDAAPFIEEDISWTKSSQDITVGHSRYVYTGGCWTLKIGHSITAEVIYGIEAECSEAGILWVGTIKGGTITEEGYTKN